MGYFITDAMINYKIKALTVGLSAENLFNNEWNEAQFATLIRLREEVAPVYELHYTPGTPLFIKGRITYNF